VKQSAYPDPNPDPNPNPDTDTGRQIEETHLFLLRVWVDESGPGQRRWQGKVQSVVYGEAYNFSEWPALIGYLLRMLPGLEDGQTPTGEGD
jgi:hypothetical protein